MTLKKYNIALADDHALFLDGISTLIDSQENMKIVYKAQNGSELVDYINITSPDICLIDIEMPIMNGLQAAEILRLKFPAIRIIILSMYQEKSLINRLMKIGVDGYLLKTCDKDELLFAINQVIKGKTYFSGEIVSNLSKEKNSSTSNFDEISKTSLLSDREKEIAGLLCNGLSNKKVAELLHLSTKTIDNHRTNIMRKLDVHNVVELIRFCLKSGIAK